MNFAISSSYFPTISVIPIPITSYCSPSMKKSPKYLFPLPNNIYSNKMMRHSHPDGTSIFGSPVFILDTLELWQMGIKSIQQKWRFISITAEVVANTDPIQLSLLNTYCLNGPVYIFDFASVPLPDSRKLMKLLIENKEIFKVVFDLEEIGSWLWRCLHCKIVYAIDCLVAHNLSTSQLPSHKIQINNFCAWIGKVNVPFMKEISQESADPEYWKRRPLIYIMHCYLSGTVSAVMKAWLDIRVGLSDDQVHAVFNLSNEVIARIAGETQAAVGKLQATPAVLNSRFSGFNFDRLCINQAFDRLVQLK